jgi:hypothetical protein
MVLGCDHSSDTGTGAEHAHRWFGTSKFSIAQSQPVYYISSCESCNVAFHVNTTSGMTGCRQLSSANTSILNEVFSAHLTDFHDHHWTLLSSDPGMPTGMPVSSSDPTLLLSSALPGQACPMIGTNPDEASSLDTQASALAQQRLGQRSPNIGLQHASTRSGGHSHALWRLVPAAPRPTLPMCCRQYACVRAPKRCPIIHTLQWAANEYVPQCTKGYVMYSQPSVSFVLATLRLCQGIQACRACHQPNSDCLHRSNL